MSRKGVTVRRHYAVDGQACALALKTLLEKSRRGDAGGKDPEGGSGANRARLSIRQGRK